MRPLRLPSLIAAASGGLLAGLVVSVPPGGASAPAAAEVDEFTAIVADSMAAARHGMRKRCTAALDEGFPEEVEYDIKRVRGWWIWLQSTATYMVDGDVFTYTSAGRGLSRYTQFSRPISRKGLARLRRAGHPNALGLRSPMFDSPRAFGSAVFSLTFGETPQRLAPDVWGAGEWLRWQVRNGVIVKWWNTEEPPRSGACVFRYRDTKVPALGSDARYLTTRWQNKHEWLPGKHLPLDLSKYKGRMR